MKFYKRILEAIQYGINLAVDDVDGLDTIEVQKKSRIKDDVHVSEILKDNLMYKQLCQIIDNEELFSLYDNQCFAQLYRKRGLMYKMSDNKKLSEFITRFFKYNKYDIFDTIADLNWLDVSEITNMRYLFTSKTGNIDVSEWDVSNVTDMYGMFEYYYQFNCDLSKWNVSKVKDMEYMFTDCKVFNCNISNWDISNVRNMSYMFNRCKHFLQDLSNWDLKGKTHEKIFDDSCPMIEKPEFLPKNI